MDASSYQNSGEIIGNAAWVQGMVGMALEIVDNSHVVIPEIPEYDVTSEVTLMTWNNTGLPKYAISLICTFGSTLYPYPSKNNAKPR